MQCVPERCARRAPSPLVTSTPNAVGAGILRPAAPIALRMTDTPPDRLSSNPRSPFFDQPLLERGIGIRFKGAQRHDVEEYCLSEGWIRVALGKKVDRHGNPLTLKLSGDVEAWFERAAEGSSDGGDTPDA